MLIVPTHTPLRSKDSSSRSVLTTTRVFAVILLALFLTGGGIMGVSTLLARTHNGFLLAIGGAVLLVLLLSPVLYFGIVRILFAHLQQHEEVEGHLHDVLNHTERIYTAVPSGILVINAEGIITYANPTACATLGYPREVVLGSPLLDSRWLAVQADGTPFPYDQRPAMVCLNTGKAVRDVVMGFQHPADAVPHWVLMNAEALLDRETGEVRDVVATFTDITSRKIAEETLRASEERFRQIAELSLDAIFQLDREGNVTYASPSFERILGYSAEESRGTHFLAYYAPEVHADVQQYFQRLLAGEDILLAKLSPLAKDGTPRYLEISATPIRRNDAITGIQGIMRDVTERKQVEDQLLLSARVIESTIEGVVITDPTGTIEFVNPAFSAITGYTAEEAIGQNPRILRSDRHDVEYYRQMWREIKEKGYWADEIWNRRKNGEAYPEWLTITAIRDDQGHITHYVSVFHDITEGKQYEEQITYQAYHDALTGLPNRKLFQDRLTLALAHAERNRSQLAVLFLDLDRFKVINDTLGHVLGDKLLQEVGNRLRQCVRQDDTVSRQGGDEFTLLLVEIAHEEDAILIAEKVLTAFHDPFQLDGHELFVTPSIGITVFPNDATTPEELIRNADTALYRAKEQGRNRYQLYTPAMNAKALERLQLENSLRKAVEREEFLLHYQPRIDLQNGLSLGVEALIRWKHPERGLVPPGQFIPLAEETGIIVPVGEWVLRTACAQHNAWVAAGFPPMRMAVNLSARQFQQENLVAMVAQVMQESGIDPHYLELEITESAAMQDVDRTLAVLHQLHTMGIYLSLDDFGTGYSSLNYLKKFPVHALKIDQSFVRDLTQDPDDAAIAMAVIALARSLNLRVIAEGVEHPDQLAFLRDQGCDEAQGYLFSRPMPADLLGVTILQQTDNLMDALVEA